MHSVWTYPWTMYEEGLEQSLETLSDIGVDAVNLAGGMDAWAETYLAEPLVRDDDVRERLQDINLSVEGDLEANTTNAMTQTQSDD